MSEIKSKFFEGLRACLEKAGIQDKEEIINNYTVQYDQKIDKGLADMEVVIALGDPSDIVEALTDSSDKNSEKDLKRKFNKSVSELINSEETGAQKNKSKKDKTSKEKKKNGIDLNIIEDKSPKSVPFSIDKPKKKRNVMTRVMLFISLVVLSLIIPLALIYAGLSYLSESSFSMECIIGLAAGIICLLLFIILRKATKNHIINSN